MHLRSMIPHFVLAWKRSIATIATVAAVHWAPEDSLSSRMSTVIVSAEVVPATEGSSPVPWELAIEGEDVRIARCSNYTDVGGG